MSVLVSPALFFSFFCILYFSDLFGLTSILSVASYLGIFAILLESLLTDALQQQKYVSALSSPRHVPGRLSTSPVAMVVK